MSKEAWACRLTGRINIQSGKIRIVNRWFDGSGDVRGKALEALYTRKDRGSPWYGDAIEVITPLGQHVTVEVPWPKFDGEEET